MDNGTFKQNNPASLIKMTLLFYSVALVIGVIAGVITFYWHTFWPVFVILYFACGITLNRSILHRIGWHPIYNTLLNVARVKFQFMFFWPLAYLGLIIRLLIVRFL